MLPYLVATLSLYLSLSSGPGNPNSQASLFLSLRPPWTVLRHWTQQPFSSGRITSCCPLCSGGVLPLFLSFFDACHSITAIRFSALSGMHQSQHLGLSRLQGSDPVSVFLWMAAWLFLITCFCLWAAAPSSLQSRLVIPISGQHLAK